MDYKSQILAVRPHLKQNSAEAYATSLKLLAPAENDDLDFLLDTKTITEKLEKYKPTTRKNHLNAVIVVLRGASFFADGAKVTKSLAFYEKIRDSYNSQYAEMAQAHRKSPKQIENWLEWTDYLDIVSKLGERVSHLRNGTKHGPWSDADRQKFQDYLLCLFYSHYVLRNDLSDVKVVGKRAYRQLSDENKSETNYLVKHDTNKYFLVLNEYKTSKKYGEKQIELDTQVLKPLRKWLRQNDTGYLFLNSAGKPLTSNGISKTFGRIGKEFRGKPFGSSLLRHSYLSHKYGTTLEVEKEKEKDADIMGHSLQTQSDYIKN
jgi:integrase